LPAPLAKPTAASQAASMAGPLIKVKPSSFILASGSLGTGKLSNKATALSTMTVRVDYDVEGLSYVQTDIKYRKN
jgi:hypothetical protein